MNIRNAPIALVGIIMLGGSWSAATAQSNERPYKLASFTEPFSDADGKTVIAFAQSEGVSFDEAKRRLVAINRLNFISYTLQVNYPEAFAGLKIKSGSVIQAILFSVEGSDSSLKHDIPELEHLIPQNARLTIKSAKKSMVQLHKEADGLVLQLRGNSVDAIIASDTASSSHRVMTQNPNAVIKSLVGKRIQLPLNSSIEYSEGVTLTAVEVSGGSNVEKRFNSNVYCTAGFNVGQISGSLRGQSTAAHCDNDLFNQNFNINLGFQQQWANRGVDSQWHTFLGGPGYLIVGKMFLGTTTTFNVTGIQAASPGSYVCKYGVTTGTTCGYVDSVYITDSYGTFPRILANSTYPIQSLEGDSGGPVYAGSLAVGMTHGRMTNPPYHNVFTPLTAWASNNLPIGVIACC